MRILDAGILSKADELVKEKNEIISKINDLQKEYSTLNLTDEEYEDLKKTLDEKLKNIEDEIKRLKEKDSEDTTPKNIEDEKKTLEEKHLNYLEGFFIFLISLFYLGFINRNHPSNGLFELLGGLVGSSFLVITVLRWLQKPPKTTYKEAYKWILVYFVITMTLIGGWIFYRLFLGQ